MMSASIGSRAAWRSSRLPRISARDGFTLLEALVSLALIAAFSAALGSYLFQSRRIVVGAQPRVRAQMVLRSILGGPIDRTNMTTAVHEGEINGLQWQWIAQPIDLNIRPPSKTSAPADGNGDGRRSRTNWAAFRIAATVSWGPGQSISAETVRLGKAE
jgi:prepilin-type N-terminal cleavage/methylation domain-containing protein